MLVCQLRLIYGLMVIGGERKAADRGGGWTGSSSREGCQNQEIAERASNTEGM